MNQVFLLMLWTLFNYNRIITIISKLYNNLRLIELLPFLLLTIV